VITPDETDKVCGLQAINSHSDDLVADTKPYQSGNIANAQFAHDVGAMVVNRAWADEKLCGYPAV